MFRNKEVGQFVMGFVGITLISALTGFIIHWIAGMLAIVSAVAFGTAFFIFIRARYHKIAQISAQIDMVLHNEDYLYISEMEEGELAILQSEIRKMTLRIREQNAALKKEKKYLADSLADIAHQLRTPLTSANLMLSLLQQSPEEKERKILIRDMGELFIQMDWLLTSLLKLSRLDAGIAVFERKQLNVNKLIHTALRPLLIPMELHNITVNIKVPEQITILADEGWLSEAIQNILKNCLESVGHNGQIEILAVDTLLFTEITIHDSGPGLAEIDLPNLFDRFYRGKHSSTTGYGIGLALCKTIITGQGGTVTAKNHPQGGAVFVIRFSK